jgi:penicillin-binding protein 1A
MAKRRNTLFLLILVIVFVIVLFLTFTFLGLSDNLRSEKELLNYKNAEASLVLSEEGEILGKYYQENRINITFDQIPQHLINALIATEDVRFYEHKGYDARSFLRVLIKTIMMRERSSGGGSTITQQLAKNMFGRKKSGMFPVLRSKISEIIMARRLEKLFTKEEILTLYLNTVSFGENVYGIEAASTRFFNKSSSSLKIEESALLIGMLKANTIYNPRLHPDNAKIRRDIVLKQMEKYKYLEVTDADSLVDLPLVIDYRRSVTQGVADYFLVQVRNETDRILDTIATETGEHFDPEKDGLIINTTLNIDLQKYAVESFRVHLSKMQTRLDNQYQTVSGKRILQEITRRELERLNLEERAGDTVFLEIFDWNGNHTDSVLVTDSLRKSLSLLHAGFLAIDPSSGGIKAWVGGIDFKTQPYDQILARRQLASVFKPVIYSAALEDGYEPCQYLDNDSVILSDFEDYSPENFDHSYGGKYSLSGALAHSMNVPTFSLFLELGFEKVDSMWNRMGFSFPLVNTPSLAMGTAEANIKEVAVAYSAFANGGFMISPFCIASIKSSDGKLIYKRDSLILTKRIISERTCILMNAMLQKAIMEGTGVSMNSVYGVNASLAGKTGTSQNYSDAWFAVYNPGLVIISRAGASSRAVHFNSGANGSGSTLALPLTALTLRKVQQDNYLRNLFFVRFPDLPPELEDALDCPDFKEKNLFDRFIDIFEKDRKTYNEAGRKTERTIRNVLRKIFKKR